jgi:peptide deformylase
MSLPDVTADVRRSTEIVVRGLAPDGTPIEITADSFEARAFQHEIDHLEGTLFLDRVASVDVFPRKRYR